MKIFVLNFTHKNNPVVSIVDKNKRLIKGIYDFNKDMFFVLESNIHTRTQYKHIYNLLRERDWNSKIIFICKKYKR